ncbi:MAG: hypothetical protein ABSE56_12775 [Bryobacteraceae bacterium]|jgi:hypothetical protein
MLVQQWKDEVVDAVKESGSTWTAFSAECDQKSTACFADFARIGKKVKRVTLSLDEFQTPEARKAEIIRQLAATE